MRKLKLDELNRLSPQEFEQLPKHPLVLVLDNIRSLNNVGSAFRTADAFAAEKIYLCGITGTPPHREIHKSALGAQETVAWEHAPNAAELCSRLKQEGYQVLAVEQAEGSTQLQQFMPAEGQKYALVFGNEVEGVSEGVMQLADAALEIPQWGTKHSLNVSVSMGIVLWSLLEKLYRE
ncbi:RNA methyltransferase [Cesiribacter sp. SM1]|uniref:RNA methyltransferase n=1 Tax=Cesiribacter sp. SM1 TaxID=2861196 RepID=UPI001CD7CBCC|nr:RNA methyltransferase [Cesiribacter sp. SM1]